MSEIRTALEAEVAKVEADERFYYSPANVYVNAPLALEQVALKTRHTLAKQMLAILDEQEFHVECEQAEIEAKGSSDDKED